MSSTTLGCVQWRGFKEIRKEMLEMLWGGGDKTISILSNGVWLVQWNLITL